MKWTSTSLVISVFEALPSSVMYHTIMTVRGQVSDEETDGDKSLVLASAITDFEACCAEFFSLV